MSLNFVSLVCDYVDGTGNPVSTGSVTFAPNATVLDSSNHQVISQFPVTVSLFRNPAPTVSLIATDNAELTPSGWGWVIQPLFPGAPPGQLYLIPFSGGATQYLSDLMPTSSVPAAPVVLSGPPSAGQVITATSPTTADWQTPAVSPLSLIPVAVKTTTYAAAAGDFVPCDTTTAAFTVTLPAAPPDKTVIAVKIVIQGAGHNVTISCAGSDVLNKTGGSTTATLSLAGQDMLFQYKAAGAIWYVLADDLPLSQLDARYAQDANNLSDLASKPAARDNLGAFKIVHAKADFGAVGDDTTDDTTALQNFFTAIGQGGSKAGYKGYIPPGTYKITAALAGASLTQCGGGGKYVTTIKQHTSNQDVLQFIGTSGAQMLGVELSDMTIQGPGKSSGSTGVGLNLNWWVDTCSLKRMIIQQNGSHGILQQNSYLVSFEHVWHYNNGGDGLHAVLSINADKWDNCEFFGNSGDGAYVSGIAASVFIGCDFETNGKHGLELANCYALTVEACDLENNGTSSAGTTYAGVYVGSTSGYAGPRITGCNFTGTGGTTANGVELSASVTSAWLEGNAFNNFANADILVDAGATGVVLAPNNIHQAGSEPLITDNSTNGVTYLGEERAPFSAVDAGYKAWNYDFAIEPNMNSASGMSNYTAGVVFGARIQVRHVMTVSKISIYWAQPSGGSPANCYLALYDSSGSRKGVSSDLTSTATGLIQASIGSVTLQPGYYYAAILIGTQGSTAGGAAYPTLTLISSQSTGYQGAGLTASQYRWAKLGNLTAQTSMPSSITLANSVSAILPFGCALL